MIVIGSNIFGILVVGLWKTFNKYVNLKVLGEIGKKIKKDPTVILVAPVTFFVGLIAWTTGIADFGLDVGVEKDDKVS